ncbi:MAG: Fibronectin/fibrinogen-binding protein [uncultured Sulfurovum sp.]|uniref:Fibronectin/fibrinogen-binding protein n=1 Tax=uncultured Sulfurovum sp. TaxID=269237 RepID=A0A6S6TS25_9BACT|nr:MAG: Fibronectin/fibrinogen-binding protein [uncultured Sulfurovum sp.]
MDYLIKYFELIEIIDYLSDFTFISRARRIENNTIELSFNKEHSYFFNMSRGSSFIYKKNSTRPLQSFNAPFDNLLHALVSSSTILNIEVPKNERIVRFTLAPKSAYKEQKITLQFEFTGRHTNAILIDGNEITIEALRHIDAHSSFRVIRPGIELLPIPPFERREEVHELGNIETYLEQKYLDFEAKQIENLKKQKLLSVQKKQEKLQKLLDKLPNVQDLEDEMKKYQNYGNIILSNLYQIKAYDKTLKTYDFEGNEISIKLPKGITPNRMSEYFFNQSKRAKSKSKNIHIEEENLRTKRNFYQNMYHAIKQAKDSAELELLVPKKAKFQRKKEKIKECELFWIDDYKVLIGRNSKENQALLKIAKSNDLWMHIRDIPSSHLIIKTDKQNLPDTVIEKAAKLCVDFSLTQAGDYDVDYCKRRFVKIQEGSSVEYDKYQTIRVRKEGIEIRE